MKFHHLTCDIVEFKTMLCDTNQNIFSNYFFLPSMLFKTLLAPLVMTCLALFDGVDDVIDDFREELPIDVLGVVPSGDIGDRGDFGDVAAAAAGFEFSTGLTAAAGTAGLRGPVVAAAALLTAGECAVLRVVGRGLAGCSGSLFSFLSADPLTDFLTGV